MYVKFLECIVFQKKKKKITIRAIKIVRKKGEREKKEFIRNNNYSNK